MSMGRRHEIEMLLASLAKIAEVGEIKYKSRRSKKYGMKCFIGRGAIRKRNAKIIGHRRVK